MQRLAKRWKHQVFNLASGIFFLLGISLLIFCQAQAVVFTTNETGSLEVSPLDDHTIVIAFQDNTQSEVSFVVYDTNGTNITGIVDLDTSASYLPYRSLGVSALNSTHFVVAWYDDSDYDATFAVCDRTGSLVTGPIDADTDVGTSYSVKVSALNSTHFVVAWADTTDYNVSFSVYTAGGSLATGPICVDDDVGSNLLVVSVSALNSTHFVVGWHDDASKAHSFAVYKADGTLVAGPTNVAVSTGYSYGDVSVSSLNSTRFVIAWYNANLDQASFSVYRSNGSSVSNADVATSSSSVQAAALNSTHFVISWADEANSDLTYAVYSASATLCVGPTDLETDFSGLYSQSCTSQESGTGLGLWSDCWVIAYKNATTESIWRGFYPNGTSWPGAVPPSNTDPSVNSPSDVSYNYGKTGNTIPWVVTDPEESSGSYTVYKNNTWHGSGTWTNATSIDYNVDGFAVGTWAMRIEATDGQGGANASDTVLVSVNAAAPSVNSPSDLTMEEGDHQVIPWIVTDADDASGTYVVTRYGDPWSHGTWTNATSIDVSLDGLAPGTWKFVINATDGSAYCSDTVTVTVKSVAGVPSSGTADDGMTGSGDGDGGEWDPDPYHDTESEEEEADESRSGAIEPEPTPPILPEPPPAPSWLETLFEAMRRDLYRILEFINWLMSWAVTWILLILAGFFFLVVVSERDKTRREIRPRGAIGGTIIGRMPKRFTTPRPPKPPKPRLPKIRIPKMRIPKFKFKL